MSHLRFNQVFFVLMGLSFVSAFLIPPKYTDLGRVQIEGLFVPLSRPAYHFATWARGKVVREDETDSRANSTISGENMELRQEVSRLQMEVKRLEQLAAERQSLGDLNSLCRRLNVTGTDSGNREGLILGGVMLSDVDVDQPVLYSGGLAGKIDRAGVTAAHVRLVTDAGFTVSGRFIRFVRGGGGIEATNVSELLPIVQGAGAGQMSITNLPMQQVKDADIRRDDWVVLADSTWPNAVKGVRLGRVDSIAPWKRAPLFAEIRLVPEVGLLRLNDVWVMTKTP
jgi:cell shape-determining protein MreC